MINNKFTVFSMILACLVIPFSTHADFGNETLLLALDGVADDQLGYVVAIDGDTAVIGAYQDDDNGSAYVFIRDSGTGAWSQQQKLTASDAASGDEFGSAVAISGDTVIVGAWKNDDSGLDRGSAYIFVRNTGVWTEQQKLLNTNGQVNDWFGRSVAIDGDTVIVGAEAEDDNGSQSGAAFIFVRSGTSWTEQQKLTAADGRSNFYFGNSVSISGDTVVVGSYQDSLILYQSGSAYVFVRSGTTWTQQQKLLASTSSGSARFGTSVSVHNDTVIIGAPTYYDTSFNHSGAAFIYTRSGTSWTEQSMLRASDYFSNQKFGHAVSINFDTAVVGAIGFFGFSNYPGAAYIYTRSGVTWTEQKLQASDGAIDDQFGHSVAVSGSNLLVGARYDDNNGADSGSAYAFTPAVAGPEITVTDSVAPADDFDLSFGDVTEFTNANQSVTVTNDGTTDLVIGTVASADGLVAPFTIETDNCSGQTLSPAANCTLSIRFAPVSTGGFADSFDIPSNDSDEASVFINLGGTCVGAPVADITVNDSVAPIADLQIAFGNVTQANTADETLTLRNDGNADLSIGNLANLDVLVAPFSLLNDTCSNQTLVVAASCTVTVRFAPVIPGVFTDSFDIPSDDADEASVIFNISGTGSAILVPDITVTDAVLPVDDLQVPFGDVAENTTASKLLSITNDGTANLILGQIAQANALTAPFTVFDDNCSGQTVIPNAACTFSVRFAPTSVASFSDSLDIPSNDADENPVTVNITGAGVVGNTVDVGGTPSGGGGSLGIIELLISLLALSTIFIRKRV